MRKRHADTIDRKFYRKLGQILFEERQKRGYSLRELEELTGITRTTLDNYELGRSRIDDARYKKVCEALQISDQVYIKIAIGMREYV